MITSLKKKLNIVNCKESLDLQKSQQDLVGDSITMPPLQYILNFFSFDNLAYENCETTHLRSVTTKRKQLTKLSTKHKDKMV